MYDIAKILMERDGISKKEADEQIDECRRRLNDEALASGSYDDAVDIIAEELGLEPDYMFDLLMF